MATTTGPLGAGYYDGLNVPMDVHLIVYARFSLCELMTTFLVCRFWHTHAKALAAKDGQSAQCPEAARSNRFGTLLFYILPCHFLCKNVNVYLTTLPL